MKHLSSLFEFKNSDKIEILANQDKFTVSYEIEMKSTKAYNSFEELDKSFKKIYNPVISKYNMVTEYDHTIDMDGGDFDSYSADSLYEYFDDNGFGGGDFGDIGFDDMERNQTRVKGIELKNKTFFKGLNEAFSFLDEFYALKNKGFKMTHETGNTLILDTTHP